MAVCQRQAPRYAQAHSLQGRAPSRLALRSRPTRRGSARQQPAQAFPPPVDVRVSAAAAVPRRAAGLTDLPLPRPRVDVGSVAGVAWQVTRTTVSATDLSSAPTRQGRRLRLLMCAVGMRGAAGAVRQRREKDWAQVHAYMGQASAGGSFARFWGLRKLTPPRVMSHLSGRADARPPGPRGSPHLRTSVESPGSTRTRVSCSFFFSRTGPAVHEPRSFTPLTLGRLRCGGRGRRQSCCCRRRGLVERHQRSNNRTARISAEPTTLAARLRAPLRHV